MPQPLEIEPDRDQVLHGRIVHFARDPPALFLFRPHQLVGQQALVALQLVISGDVFVDDDGEPRRALAERGNAQPVAFQGAAPSRAEIEFGIAHRSRQDLGDFCCESTGPSMSRWPGSRARSANPRCRGRSPGRTGPIVRASSCSPGSIRPRWSRIAASAFEGVDEILREVHIVGQRRQPTSSSMLDERRSPRMGTARPSRPGRGRLDPGSCWLGGLAVVVAIWCIVFTEHANLPRPEAYNPRSEQRRFKRTDAYSTASPCKLRHIPNRSGDGPAAFIYSV